MKKQQFTYQLEKLQNLQDYTLIQYVRLLIKVYLNIIELHQDKENTVKKVFLNTLIIILLMKKSKKLKNKIIYMLELVPKNNLMILKDKLISSEITNKNTLIISLLKILVQGLTLKEKDCKPFWTLQYKELSEMLSLPTKIDLLDLDSNSLNTLSPTKEERSQLLTIKKLKVQNKNSQKTFYQSYIYSLAEKWEKESINNDDIILKTRKIVIYPNKKQKEVLDEWFNTSRYLYNKALNVAKETNNFNFQSLRNKLVNYMTTLNDQSIIDIENKINECKEKESKKELIELRKKLIKEIVPSINPLIETFELNTPKEIRASIIRKLCDNYKVAIKNLKNNNIKKFNISFRTKKQKNQYCYIPKSLISIENFKIKIAPQFLKKNGGEYFKVNKNNKKLNKKLKSFLENQEIQNDTILTKLNGKYTLCIPIKNEIKNKRKIKEERICGIDPGKRTFLTCYSNKDTVEYKVKENLFKKLNEKIDILKSLRNKKKSILKREQKLKNYTNEIHNKTINSLVKSYDCIFMGDFESQKVSSKIKNKTNNRYYSNISFYLFKQKLEFKCKSNGIKLKFINEAYTSKTCSCCGSINNSLGSKEYFECKECDNKTGRDINASKNILMKGILN